MTADSQRSLALNQASLQDFLDCPRRFELGTLRDAPWPAAPSSPLATYEMLTDLGNRFHQLCQQFLIGIDPGLIASQISDPDLLDLWRAFLPYAETLLPFPAYAEQILRIPFEDHFLIAKFDLIVQLPSEEFLILDWKTSSRKPARTALGSRVQTFLYPFIFQQAGSDLFSVGDIPSSAIKMQYWYPLVDDPEETFPYSDSKHLQVSQMLSDLLADIDANLRAEGAFPLTEDHKRCTYCIYRSYCERGHQASPVPAGADLEFEDLSNSHFDFELIKEIEF